MSKIQIFLDKDQLIYPENGNPLSLANVKQIVLSNLDLVDATISVHLTGIFDPDTYVIQNNQQLDPIEVEYPQKWDRLSFTINRLSNDAKATFTYELVPRII